MLKHIRPLIPSHSLYTEAFAGGLAVLFDKEPVEVEVINDLNVELINFYETCVTDFEALKYEVDKTLHSRAQHEHAWYIYNNPSFFSNVQRAWAVWVLSKMGFAGQLSNSFGFDKSKSRHPKKIGNAKEAFNDDLRARLSTLTIEHDDALKIIKRYDIPEAFHFVDPPYVGSNMGHYSNMFNDSNLRDLLDLLTTVKGKFMLTMYPNEVIQSYVNKHGWSIEKVNRQVSACKAESRRIQEEWMVMNYSLQELANVA